MSGGRWFRLYDCLLNDPKVQKLPPKAFKVLINLWCIASQNGGVIPEDDLPYKLRMRPCHVKDVLNLLFSLTLLERDGNALVPHQWRARNPNHDHSAERTRAYRKKTRHSDAPVTPLEVEVEVDKTRVREKASKDAPNGAAHPKAFSNWNSAARQLTLSPAKDLTPERKKKMRVILEKYGLDGWNQALQNIAEMPFCCGENDRSWRVTIDWLLKPANFVKILEKTYDKPRNEGGHGI